MQTKAMDDRTITRMQAARQLLSGELGVGVNGEFGQPFAHIHAIPQK